MKIKLFIITLFSLVYFKVDAQSNTLIVNPSSQQVISFNASYYFQQTYSYDFNRNIPTSYAYSAPCLVIIQILDGGVGKLITSLDGEVNSLNVIACYQKNDRYSFSLINKNGVSFEAVLLKKNGYIDKFWIKSETGGAVIFDN
jgi:hypothetical protein